MIALFQIKLREFLWFENSFLNFKNYIFPKSVMKSFVILEMCHRTPFPSNLGDFDDVRMPESLIEYFLNLYTKIGDSVLDVFAGFGTTLFIAEEMGRIPYGIEYEEEKCAYIREKLCESYQDNIIHGDSREVSKRNLPKIDFLITSPPYMRKEDTEAPLTAYHKPGNYSDYLMGLQNIFKALKDIIKPGGFLVVEVSNLVNREKNTITTLAWDIGKTIAEVLVFKGEVIIAWEAPDEGNKETYGYGYDHSYCLVYQNELSK